MSIPTVHSFAFDPTYGMHLQELQAIAVPEAPAGFDDFWHGRYQRAIAVDPQPRLRHSKLRHDNWHVFGISYITTDALQINGWLLIPREGQVRRGLVVGHGYGGRDQPDFDLPLEETAILFPCFRGLSLSACPAIPPDAPGHVLCGIEHRDSYVIGGCVEDLWLGVSALETLYPWVAGQIGYSGISFGGGIGALAIPFDSRIDRGHLVVPTFGDRQRWLTLPTVGSAQSVQMYQETHGSVLETLRFFDAAIAASRIDVPMLIAPALFDPAVAPPCQFAVANATQKFNETFILDAGHFEYDGMDQQNAILRDKVGQFFKAS
ncbi:acetylxylan esterase [Rhizobium sp. P38BS-XIX]|uniref:acetylxylan esterase n=1 Tax=Rhizobium sp. P38BS-XIX TaxID=2726740 RepID=UPI0014568E0D|nr:acetylxylan esterase [Rhizobium sp. P38BS-XIX]NLR98001.1 acetylxylan esterase [Rhizobium sp. P38BS-XIX]